MSNGREIFKEMFNVFSHQGFTNQNVPEIPSYAHQDGKDLMTALAVKDMEQEKHSCIGSGSANMYNHFGNQFDGFSENWE